jgi:hypothetical protein
MLAELAGPVEALGEKPVERVGERRHREQGHHRRITTLEDPRGDRIHERDAQHAQQVGQVAQAHGR